MNRLKFVYISIFSTVTIIILSSHLHPLSKLISPFQSKQIQKENPSANTMSNMVYHCNLDKRSPSDDSQLLSPSKNGSPISATEMVSLPYKTPPVYFRDLFNETYFSQVKTGPDHVSVNTKYLIYRCDTVSMKVCGGWADRIKGVIAGYLIANLTGRVFKMEMLSSSCDVRQFYLPNFVNWSLPVSFHKVVKPNSEVAIMNLIDQFLFSKQIKNINFSSLPAMKAKYVYYKSNLEYMDSLKQSSVYQNELSWMQNLTRDQINSAMFKRLFKPSPWLKNQVGDFLKRNLNQHNRLVCLHARTGRNPSIPYDTVVRMKETDLPRVWDFLRNVSKDDGDKIFLMTDSDNVLKSAKRESFHDKLFYSSGKIVHVEKSRNIAQKEMCSGLGRMLSDQFTLMHCDVLVISKSGLSRMAAYVRGSDQGLYCILEGGRVIPCQMSQMTETYGIMG